jgi:hypothetical protein
VTLRPAEAGPAPTAFTAFNVTVYEVPAVKPVIVTGVSASAGLNAVYEPPSMLN